MSIKDNVERLRETIPSDVNILAATKTRTVPEIKEVINSGIRILGENYVQEAEEKYSQINEDIELYFIGHLQKNKVNKALDIFNVINIDSLKIAEAINKRAEKVVKVTIEVNISGEEQKQGCRPEDLVNLVEDISKLENIKIIGIMAMAPYLNDPEMVRPYFKKMKKLFDTVKDDDLTILSMGMSGDYSVAIQEGSNMVRIGSSLFN